MKALHNLDGNQVAELVRSHNQVPEESPIIPLDCILGSMGQNFIQFSHAIDNCSNRR